jgi:transposase InsO family protein
VSDFTYVATWNGFVYVAFVLDVFTRRIVGAGACRRRCVRGVNYFRRLATTISAGQGQQRVSPTTWRYTVVVVGRLVAVENVSAGAPIGA